MSAYEIESLFKECENFDDSVYRPENLVILNYCYGNYEFNADIDAFFEKVSAVQEDTNILQESMEEGIDENVSSLDEKDEEESEEQKEEEWIDHPCPPSNESNSSTHTLFNFPSCLPEDDCYDPVDSLEIPLFDDSCYDCGHDANMNDHWCASVLNKRFLTPFRDNIWNRRQVSVGDRGVLPTRPRNRRGYGAMNKRTCKM